MFPQAPLRRLTVLVALALAMLGALADTVGAQTATSGPSTAATSAQTAGGDVPARRARVEVVKASGLLDEVLVDFIGRRIDTASAEGFTAVVIQLNSGGATVSDERLVALADKMRSARVPVGVWVGPSGAQAKGRAAQLVAAAQPGGLAAGARVGRSGPQILPPDRFGVLWGAQANRLESTFVSGRDADQDTLRDLGLVFAPVLVDFVGNLEGVAVLPTEDGGARKPDADVRFTSLTLAGQLMHTVASPSAAYLLLAIGLGLIVFELYTAGIGIAGVVGAVCLALACVGLVALPARGWAIALLVAAFVAFAVDVQTGVPRFWTGVGFVAFLVGTFALFDGVGLSWITVVVVLVGLLLTYLSGMPAMVRTRFSTSTIGRDWMIGELGLALSAVDPDGTVSVRSARWPARTNRATPIAAGDRIRVVGIEGIILEVEPEIGAARDYRERRGKDSTPNEAARDS